MFGLRNRRRSRLRSEPLEPELRLLLEAGLPSYDILPTPLRDELEGLVRVFLDEKSFEGCGGLQITDEIRLTIAGHASLLILGRPTSYYPLLSSVLVYPDSYTAPVSRHGPAGLVTESEEERIGESWSQGSVVLSWRDICDDLTAPELGCSVIVHEFAHQLDDENSEAEGVPVLPDPAMYEPWARVMATEYAALVDAVACGRESLLDGYGAQSPAEFFAVVSECFFTLPVELEAGHPELYGQLASLYRQQPAQWVRGAG